MFVGREVMVDDLLVGSGVGLSKGWIEDVQGLKEGLRWRWGIRWGSF